MATNAVQFDSVKALDELNKQGYTVVPNVLTDTQCDKHIEQYKEWLKQFDGKDFTWHSGNSLIQAYKIGHFQASWEIRLEVKDVFSKLWGTEKLLTSADAVGISKPPEEGSNLFAVPNSDWFHLDQNCLREGLHAYQGGVYLEEATETDQCFRVLSKSHLCFKEFHNDFPKKKTDSEFYRLKEKEKKWYYARGCKITEVPVPKGGMVLWDSRIVNDNKKPSFDRQHKDRWGFVNFVCMTPAVWAEPEDITKKHEAYKKLQMTTHWPSQGVNTIRDAHPKKSIETIDTLPDIAKTGEAKLLFGIDSYDFCDDKPNGPEPPTWVRV